MSTTAFTIMGFVGTNWVRMTAHNDDGAYTLRTPSGSLVLTLPSRFRTCGDIGRMMAEANVPLNAASVPAAAIAAHPHARKGRGKKTYKAERTLRQAVLHMVRDAAVAKAIVTGLEATYSVSLDDVQIAA